MPQLKVRIGCVVLAVVLSAVTYYFVEPKLRWGRFGGYKAAGLLSVMVVIGVAGYSVERHDGYTARMDDPEQTVIDAINKRMLEDNKRCLKAIPDWNRLSDGNTCKIQRNSGQNTIALIGDSHSGHLYSGLITKTSSNEGIAVFPASCAIPLIGLHSAASSDDVKHFPFRANTEHLLSEAFSYILSHRNITKVVLSHHPGCSWQNVVDLQNPGNHDFNSILHDGFARTYDALTKAGKEIYVVLDNPPYRTGWSKCKASVVRRPVVIPEFMSSKKAEICSVKQSEREDRELIENWSKIAHETAAGFKNVHFIDLSEVFCKNGSCSMVDQKSNMLYGDAGHLNTKGSILAAPFIFSKLRE